MRVGDHGARAEQRHARPAQRVVVDRLQPGDLRVLGRDEAPPVEPRLADGPAVAGRVLEGGRGRPRRRPSASSARSRGSRRCRRSGIPRRARPSRRARPRSAPRARRPSRRRSRRGRSRRPAIARLTRRGCACLRRCSRSPPRRRRQDLLDAAVRMADQRPFGDADEQPVLDHARDRRSSPAASALRIADPAEMQVEDVMALVGDQRRVPRHAQHRDPPVDVRGRQQRLDRGLRHRPAEAHDLHRQREGPERRDPLARVGDDDEPVARRGDDLLLQQRRAAALDQRAGPDRTRRRRPRSGRAARAPPAARAARRPRPRAAPWRSRSRRSAPSARLRRAPPSSRTNQAAVEPEPSPSRMPGSTSSSARAAAARLARSAGEGVMAGVAPRGDWQRSAIYRPIGARPKADLPRAPPRMGRISLASERRDGA